MSPDDKRHGSEAGHRAHARDSEKSCQPCLDAHAKRNNLRRLYPHKRPAIGSQRRIQALQALGYSRVVIAHELGYSDQGSLTYLMRADSVLNRTADRIADAYDRLSMTVPQTPRAGVARSWAKRHGFAPPLAWNDRDIDDPNARPHGDVTGTTTVDPVVVDRLLAGQRTDSTPAEKNEAMRRWVANGGSRRQLALTHGWNDGRYGKDQEAAS